MDNLSKVYKKSESIIEREIEGEMILIPMLSDTVDLEKGLFLTLNETAKEIWRRIDGKRKVLDIVEDLESIYEADKDDLMLDVVGLFEELIEREMVLEVGIERIETIYDGK
ncbi:MAG: hypothetical protein COW10_05170 [Candidatus Omnitrophica bacterium CG12_big_fil_rev_8_21_14_0_65_42_8]|nr:MAG: hypothetical protein COW10_05170 [Candidatus Omnitrophica bacterium CG12_big_fil_rev_8_21_14_0_65_42_8]